jgi:hypothetical protein
VSRAVGWTAVHKTPPYLLEPQDWKLLASEHMKKNDYKAILLSVVTLYSGSSFSYLFFLSFKIYTTLNLAF